VGDKGEVGGRRIDVQGPVPSWQPQAQRAGRGAAVVTSASAGNEHAERGHWLAGGVVGHGDLGRAGRDELFVDHGVWPVRDDDLVGGAGRLLLVEVLGVGEVGVLQLVVPRPQGGEGVAAGLVGGGLRADMVAVDVDVGHLPVGDRLAAVGELAADPADARWAQAEVEPGLRDEHQVGGVEVVGIGARAEAVPGVGETVGTGADPGS
jgi:hypothetical protein